MKHAYLDTPNGQVHYVAEGRGEPLLLIHESPRSWVAYARMIPFSSENHRVIAMDTPGFGNSEAPSHPYNMGDYADSVDQFMDCLGIDAADVMGEHTGACIGVELAARWPARVRKLILNGLPLFPTTEARLARLEQVKRRTMETEDIEGSHFDRVWQWALPKVMTDGKGDVSPEDMDLVAGYTFDALNAGKQWKQMGMAVFSYDPRSRLPMIQAETLIISETGETLNPYTQQGQELNRLIPHSSLAIIQAGDSRFNSDAAKELTSTVLRFLRDTSI